MESDYGSMKTEKLYREKYHTREDARAWIDSDQTISNYRAKNIIISMTYGFPNKYLKI